MYLIVFLIFLLAFKWTWFRTVFCLQRFIVANKYKLKTAVCIVCYLSNYSRTTSAHPSSVSSAFFCSYVCWLRVTFAVQTRTGRGEQKYDHNIYIPFITKSISPNQNRFFSAIVCRRSFMCTYINQIILYNIIRMYMYIENLKTLKIIIRFSRVH